jgi:hypothetical protein
VASADLPVYAVEIIAPIDLVTSIKGASDAGHVVGWRVVGGQVRAFVATPEAGFIDLPLTPGAVASEAYDVNVQGVVVGRIGTSPAVWTPNLSGGYDIATPQVFASLPSPLGGNLAISSSSIIAINDAGVMVGTSTFQGFQGGPSTRFSLDGPPVDLRTLGFDASVTDINNGNVVLGGELMLDLDTGVVTDLGTPSAGPFGSIQFAIGYAINDSNQVVAAAARATSSNEVWVTYRHEPAVGWVPNNPNQLAARFTGFYDNNNRGDVSASGGVYFAAEDTLVFGYASLLRPEDSAWQVALGHIATDRKVYTTASLAGEESLVVLVPEADDCQVDLNADGALDFFDIAAFLSAFTAMQPAADWNNDALFDFFDVAAFLDAFAEGC